MRILAFDLAWNGPTGYVLYDDDKGNPFRPFVDYGELKMTAKGKKESKVSYARETAACLFGNIGTLIDRYNYATLKYSTKSELYVVYEYTDWHRPLSRSGNWKKDYAIERRAQWSLGMATATFLLSTSSTTAEVPAERLIGIGANEAKKEFGAQKKSAVRRILASDYPERFEFEDDGSKEGLLYDKALDQQVSDHVSDAMALAIVVKNRLYMPELK